MLLLAFDTAGPFCSAAVASEERGLLNVLARRSERLGRGHAERLVPMLDDVLAEAGLRYRDVERVAVTTGPGSFTGVRVGVAAARGLALALDVTAVGVGSLQALVRPIATVGDGAAVAVLDGRRDDFLAYAVDNFAAAPLFGPAAMRFEQLAASLAAAPRPWRLAGSAAPRLAAALGDIAVEVRGAAESPDIGDVAALAMSRFAVAPPTPFYARGADAKPQAAGSVARREPA